MKEFGCFVCRSLLLGLASIALLSGCSLLPRFYAQLPGNQAFILQWPTVGFADLYAAAVAAKPSAQEIRIGRLTLKGTDPKIDEAVDEALAKTGFQLVQLDENFREKWEQAEKDSNTIAAAGAWISDKRFLFAPGVSARTKSAIRAGRIDYLLSYDEAVGRQAESQNTLMEVFRKVDLTSLRLIGPRLGEAQLLNAGRLVEAAVKNKSENLSAPPGPVGEPGLIRDDHRSSRICDAI